MFVHSELHPQLKQPISVDKLTVTNCDIEGVIKTNCTHPLTTHSIACVSLCGSLCCHTLQSKFSLLVHHKGCQWANTHHNTSRFTYSINLTQ